jgi:stringent starvation protein B
MNPSAASIHPYLVRATHEWCLDNGLTPYVVARVDGNVLVPPGYVREGQIVLNLDPGATNRLSFSDEGISFQARFAGVAHDLWVPYGNLLAIYARETGRGLAFTQGVAFELNPEAGEEAEGPARETEDGAQDASPAPEDDEPPRNGGRGGHLKVIK